MQKDILIIGGGPAGISTALHLVQMAPELQPRVLVLEKGRYPRQKLCAGALSPDAEQVLNNLGLDLNEVPHVDVTGGRLDFAGTGAKVALPGPHSLRVVQRQEFDAWLARKAMARGIEVRDATRVLSVRPGPHSVIVETDSGSLEAQVVVGADGSNGVTRRSVLPDAKVHKARLLEVTTPTSGTSRSQTATAVPPASERNSEAPYMQGGTHGASIAYADFFPVPHGIAGYTWDVPTQIGGQPMRCWGIYDANIFADSDRTPLRDLLADEMRRNGYEMADYTLRGHPVQWFSIFGQLSVPRVILAGDAAGVDGILGGGISHALGYGQVAATAVRDAFAKGDFSFSDYRRRLLQTKLGRGLAIRTSVTEILYRLRWTWFQKFFWRLFSPAALFLAIRLVANWSKAMKASDARSAGDAASAASR